MTKQPFLTRLKALLGGSRLSAQTPSTTLVPEGSKALSNFDFADERIPSASLPRIEKIEALLMQIEAQAALTESGRDALDEARRIRNKYLPELMISYFQIPSAHRAEIFRRTGKSASFQLNERLDTMIDELHRISASFAADKIDLFTVNLRFIDQNFIKKSDPFS